MVKELPQDLDAEGSILFLGSGFTQSAKNIRGTSPPMGNALKTELARLLDVAANDYDLRTLADEAAMRPGVDLYQLLYELYTVRELDDDQKTILRLPWRRIYTTNYDEAPELFYLENRQKVPTYTFDDDKPRKLLPGSIIHLHGKVSSATRDNLADQLILTEGSYVRQHLTQSPWYDDFCRDLRFCTNCYFIGYSASDGHISALLLKEPRTIGRTYFVTRHEPDGLFANRLKQYGTISPIEIRGFADLCRIQTSRDRRADPTGPEIFLVFGPIQGQEDIVSPDRHRGTKPRNLRCFQLFAVHIDIAESGLCRPTLGPGLAGGG